MLDKSQMKEVENALKISFGIVNEYSKKSSHNL